MKKSKLSILVFSLVLFVNLNFSQNTQVSSFSALNCVVVKSKDYISLSSDTIKANVERIIKDVASKNFNSVAFKVNEDGFVIYSSTLAPKLKLEQKQLPQFDIISFAYNEAKKYNLGFFVVFEILKTTSGFNPKWYCRTKKEIYYPYYLCCGNLETQVYVRKLLEEFLMSYSVDGVLLTEIKYPNKNTSYDEVSLNRFYMRGNPRLLEYEDFQREQLNKLVEDIYSLIKSLNENIVVGVLTEEVYKDSFTLSGVYYENFQDPILWLERNFCDFLLVRSKKATLSDILKVYPRQRTSLYLDGSNLNNLLRNLNDTFGFFCDYSLKLSSLTTRYDFPKVELKNKIILGRVLDETGQPIQDAWITLTLSSKRKLFTFSSYDGFFSFSGFQDTAFDIKVEYPYCQEVVISTESEKNIVLVEPIIVEASKEKQKLFINILQPKDFLNPKSKTIHILARTHPKNKVEFYSENFSTRSAVFATGIVAIDNVRLKEGINSLKFIISRDKNISEFVFNVFYSTETAPKEEIPKEIKEEEFLWLLDEKDYLLFSGDVLELKIKAPSKKEIYALCFEDATKIKMEEIEDGIYYALYKIPDNFSSKRTKIKFEVVERFVKESFLSKKEEVKTTYFEPDVYLEVWNSFYPLIGVTVSRNTPISYSTYRQRLGGPYIAELPRGIKLQIVEKKQNNYKVRLSEFLTGWVETKDIELLRNEKKPIENSLLSCVVSTQKGYDRIVFSLRQLTAFSLSCRVEGNKNYVIVDLFNTSLSANWIQSFSNTKVIDDIKTEQLEDGWTRVTISLKTKQNWGFWWENTASNLIVNIKHPPTISKENPFKGIKIALEAGHGGENNTGAFGLSGSKEKNINLKFTQILASHLKRKQAKVILMREGDTNPSFEQRLKVAYDNNADLILSIHANASSNSSGYLNSSQGPSVYYKHDNSKKLAEYIQKELVNLWKKNFGVISNFNYAIVRQSRIPAVLVEMGFMTHPEDESYLLDEEFLDKQAERISKALEKFLLDQ